MNVTAYRVMDATPDLLERVAETARAGDRAEVEAGGHSIREAVVLSALASVWARVAIDDRGEPMAAWGVVSASPLARVGAPWMISTGRISPKALLSESRRQVAEMLGDDGPFDVLVGEVDERYGAAMRWIRWMGFALGERLERNGVPFRRYEMRRI